MAENKAQLPQSSAGLTRYYDTNAGGMKLSPKLIIAIAFGFSSFVAIINIVA